MALTVLDMSNMALASGNTAAAMLIAQFAESRVLQRLPFIEVSGNAYSWMREETLGTNGWRGYNGSFSEDTGTVSPQMEALKLLGGDLDVDRSLVRSAGPEMRSRLERMKVKNLALEFERSFFKGDSQSSAYEMDGLQKRLTGTQLVDAGATSGGDALSLGILDEALSLTKGSNQAIYCNRKMVTKFKAASRNVSVGGYVQFEPSEMGAPIMTYAGVPIVMIEEDGSGNEILPFTEANPGGGSPASTSIYIVSHEDMGVTGLQNGPIEVRDLGEVDDKPVLRTRIDWMVSFGVLDGRSATRIQGVKDAAIVA